MISNKLSELIAPPFYGIHKAIKSGKVNEVIAKGGRGSTKSSFIGLEIILLMLMHPDCHCVVLRKVGDKLRNSVFAQLQWAIDHLGLHSQFTYTVSPMEITRKSTGQKILFFGLDDPGKVKSLKMPFGYVGILWFEEFDQFDGPQEIRSVEQSVFRGGPYSFSFKSFNPPPMMRNWANTYALENKPGRLVHHSTYLDVPTSWLGERFIMDAEYLKETKPINYRHEYLGEMIGNGTQVFDNIVAETISPKKILGFEPIMNGVDWGWYPDPWTFNRMYFDTRHRVLYIFDELTRNKLRNDETANLIKGRIGEDEIVFADGAENKSCADYREYGIRCRAFEKGPGSVKRGTQWLQGLNKIIIDPSFCPDTLKEFSEYEYETGKDGEVLPGYPDLNNHHIDAVRYATNRIWNRRGAA